MQPYISNTFHPIPSTHEHSTFLQRVSDRITSLIRIILAIKDVMARKQSIMADLGIAPYTTYADRWRYGLVLVNNFFGFEASSWHYRLVVPLTFHSRHLNHCLPIHS